MAIILSTTNGVSALAQSAPTQPAQPAAAPAPELPPGTTGQATTSSANGEPLSFPAPDQIGPDSDAKHNQNKTLSMNALRLHSAVSMYSFKTVRQEVGFDQPISLEEALKYAIQNNLAIKISRESMQYQHYVLYGNMASMLPSFSLAYNLERTDIQNEHVNSLARVQLERLNYPVFQGGSVVYGLLAQSFRARGWTHAYHASINDTLLQVYQSYNNLLLARVLLQIRAKAVEVDQEQLRVNQQLEANGAGTRFAVMQSDAILGF